jgi:hypothetical protein
VSKRLVTQLFIGSLIAAVGGVVLLLVSVGLAWAGGLFIMNGPDVVGVRSTPWGWVLFGLGTLAVLALLAAALVQFVAWIGAVLDAARMSAPTLLVVLLVTGLLSFGIVGMIVYLIMAPADDDPERVARSTAPAASPAPAHPAPAA